MTKPQTEPTAEKSMAEPLVEAKADLVMDDRPYQNPVAQLVCLDIKTHWSDENWLDYRETYGLTLVDRPELIRLVHDEDPQHFEGLEPQRFAFIHALRALLQLDLAAGITFYLELLEGYPYADLFLEEAEGIGRVVGSVGIAPLKAFLANKEQDVWNRVAACDALTTLGQSHSQERATIVEILTAQLRCYGEQTMDEEESEILNSSLVDSLVKLKAVESVDLIEEVFEACDLEEMTSGTWPAVQVALGLKQESDFPPEALKPLLPSALQQLQEIGQRLQFMSDLTSKRSPSPDPLSFPSAAPRKSASKGFGTTQPSPTGKNKAKNKAKKKR